MTSLPIIPCSPHATSEVLAGWRANVGGPLAYDPPGHDPAAVSADHRALLVLSWNVWIGRGRLGELIAAVRHGAYASLGAEPDLPLVVLLQEALRADDSVPVRSNGRAARELAARVRGREDVAETAARQGLYLRYAPSMRNGPPRSDRGNAILSTLPLDDARGIELPLVLQRRVAVTAAVAVGGRRLRVVTAHLAPRGPIGYKWMGAAGRAQQARHLLDRLEDDTVVLGADLNLGRGRAEPAWQYLAEAGFEPGMPPVEPSWRHTYHALPRLILDYIVVRDSAGMLAGARIHRLDENPADRGRTVFGSDHHPLLARIDLR
ncbi:MAG: hypothetical protein H0T68_03930 [Gemmatimonadales bacterium]|nr:hypothetical protein [Gemmatimonadales bacterium]